MCPRWPTCLVFGTVITVYISVSVLMCVTFVASAPVYVCVASAHCSPPAVGDTGPQGALWETETGAEDLLEREREAAKNTETIAYISERMVSLYAFLSRSENLSGNLTG